MNEIKNFDNFVSAPNKNINKFLSGLLQNVTIDKSLSFVIIMVKTTNHSKIAVNVLIVDDYWF